MQQKSGWEAAGRLKATQRTIAAIESFSKSLILVSQLLEGRPSQAHQIHQTRRAFMALWITIIDLFWLTL